MVYYVLAFQSGNLAATVEFFVDCLKRRDGLFGGVFQPKLWQ